MLAEPQRMGRRDENGQNFVEKYLENFLCRIAEHQILSTWCKIFENINKGISEQNHLIWSKFGHFEFSWRFRSSWYFGLLMNQNFHQLFPKFKMLLANLIIWTRPDTTASCRAGTGRATCCPLCRCAVGPHGQQLSIGTHFLYGSENQTVKLKWNLDQNAAVSKLKIEFQRCRRKNLAESDSCLDLYYSRLLALTTTMWQAVCRL